jgi:hypothetical protein
MNAPMGMVVFAVMMLLFQAYCLVQLWKWPLQNGTGFFIIFAVPEDFYEGPGRVWLKSYRAMLIALYLLLAGFFGGCFAFGRWNLILLCGLWALPFTAAMFAFYAWTRRKLGANPPVRAVAVALESRRLGDYISWPQEALMVAFLACSWWLLLLPGGRHVAWIMPLMLTWMSLGFLPGKILLVRHSYPIPAERAEERYQYQEARKRNAIKVSTAGAWGIVVFLFGFALARAFSPSKAALILWLSLTIGVSIVPTGYCLFLILRGERKLEAMHRELGPSGSWATPYRRKPWMSRPYWIWFAIWMGGILAMGLYPLFR